ncbi:hypothetical protein HYFRA_00007574 [Hymenoscyphus fraxineus]|uniref:C2H2-type domain-containing protein n=1 Tax=Hymenoscyphus fraxineus TaxID=746836 RepID=A0A9N9KVG6_9HELO|nr:hypothetical protein HYFRA_00007574 [Hymenoscyphus fraxineus]
MEWIGNSTSGLRIEDSRRELAENPLAHSQDWDLRKYPAVLATDQRKLNQKTSASFDLPTHPQNHPFPLEAIPTSFDGEVKLGLESSSPASSRANSIDYSSCFSRNESAGSSSSTGSSLSSFGNSPYATVVHAPAPEDRGDALMKYAGRHDASPEEPPIFLNDIKQQPAKGSPAVHVDFRQPVYENNETRPVVNNLRAGKAFSHHKQMINEKKMDWVKDDLEKEERQMKRDRDKKKKKQRPRLEPRAVPPVNEARYDIQDPSAIQRVSVQETSEDTFQATRTVDNPGSYCSPRTSDILSDGLKFLTIKTLSNTDSQTPSISTEDATDWEDDSNLDESCRESQVRLSHFLETPTDIGTATGSQNKLAPIKSNLSDKLLLDLWRKFNEGHAGIRQHGSPGQSTRNSTASESGVTSGDSLSVRSGKRCRGDNSEDGNDNEGHERRRKRAPSHKLLSVEEDDSLTTKFACPFRKHDPRKYSIQTCPLCAMKPHKSIARLKTHLYEKHLIEQCPRCKSVFESEEALEAHNMGEERCEAAPDKQVDGMTRKMRDQIRNRKKPYPGQTDGEKWENIYKILFPNETVPDPYFEPIPDHGAGTPQSPDNVNIIQYQDHLRRVIPGFVENSLDERHPTDAQLKRQMKDIIREALDQAFISFRDNFTLGSTATEPLMHTDPPSNHHPESEVETFLLASPPTNSTSRPILPTIIAKNKFSDSGYGSHPSMSTNSQQDPSEFSTSDTAPLSSSNEAAQANLISKMDFQTESDFSSLLGFDGMNDFLSLDGTVGYPDLDLGEITFF